MTNHYPNEQDALANLRRKYEALEAERDAALNKAESLGWAVDALKQSVETMERRAGGFKAERDKLEAENVKLRSERDKLKEARMRDLWQAVDKTEGWQV